MGRIGVALRVFFRALTDAEFSARLRTLLDSGPTQLPPPQGAPPQAASESRAPASRTAARGQALDLLAALQREARFVDFIKEPIGEYSDAQIGAAVRDVHRDCAAVLERWFGVRPLVDQPEGAALEVPAGYEAGRFRLTGNVTGQPPYRGALAHHGWEASRCELPAWTGGAAAEMVIAPAEVELT
jgi:hypothetical protein